MTDELTTTPRTPGMSRRDWAALLTIGFGVSLVIMDATIVNVALPVVIEDLGLKPQIPPIGDYGIPIRDEIALELLL